MKHHFIFTRTLAIWIGPARLTLRRPRKDNSLHLGAIQDLQVASSPTLSGWDPSGEETCSDVADEQVTHGST